LKGWRKYTATLALSVESAMEYRTNFLLSLASGSFAILIQYFVWTAIYESNPSENLFGYEYQQMIVYIVLAGLLSKVMATGFEWEIASDIKNGGLSRFLVQPIRYLPYRIMSFMGTKIVQLVMFSAISIIIFLVLSYTIGLEFDFSNVGLLLFVILLSLLLNCLLFYCISALAFWVSEISAVFIGLGVTTNILSGGIFPLDVFGDNVEKVLTMLPFPYVIYFPLNVINGIYSTKEILAGMIMQCLWIIVCFVVAKFLWHKGMKKYVAIGG